MCTYIDNSIMSNYVWIIIIIVVVLLMLWHITRSAKSFIYGWYGADPVFCEQANLDSIIMYLNNDGCGYILIKANDGSVILNESFAYTLSARSSIQLSLTSPQKYTIHFKDIEYQDFFPSIQTLEFIPLTQRIKLYDEQNETTHAILYKNNTVSDIMK